MVDQANISDDNSIKIITGSENITNFMLESYKRANRKMDTCLDFVGPSIVATDHRIMNGVFEMLQRGIKIRFITDVTKENINYCKDLMEVCKIRHIEGIKGNFGILDENEYVIHLIHLESQAPSQIIYSNDKVSADAQQFLFNTLWKNAIPIEERLREIEYGIKIGFVDTIRDPKEIRKICFDIITSTTKELSIIFPTANGFYGLGKEGLISLLEKMGTHGVHIRMLTPMDNKITKVALYINKKYNQIEIKPITNQQTISSIIITSDGKFSLVIELKDEEIPSFIDSIRLAVYSNSTSNVWTYTTLFENLWIQSDITV